MLQPEEEALLLQQCNMRQVLMYKDPARQEAAWKTVPVDELKKKALVSLAKVSVSVLFLLVSSSFFLLHGLYISTWLCFHRFIDKVSFWYKLSPSKNVVF